MRILKRVTTNPANDNGFHVIDKLSECKPCPLGQRWSSDINKHINARAGLKLDIKNKVKRYSDNDVVMLYLAGNTFAVKVSNQ